MKPKRKFEVTITIAGDTWQDVVAAHDHLLVDLTEDMRSLEKTRGTKCGGLGCLGPSSYTMAVVYDENQTAENYRKQIDQWFENITEDKDATRVLRQSESEVRKEEPQRGLDRGDETRPDSRP